MSDSTDHIPSGKSEDEELRRQIRMIGLTNFQDVALDKIMQLITARDAEREAAIRMDELNSIGYRAGGYDIEAKGGILIDERIAELETIKRNKEQ